MSSSQAVWTVLGAFAALLLIIAVWTLRRARSVEDFHLAGRGLGVIRGGLSAVASAYSFWVIVGVTGAAFTLGWSAIWFAIGILLGALFAWFFVGPAVRRAAERGGAETALQLVGGTGEASAAATISVTSIAAVAALFGIVAQLGFAGMAVAREIGMHPAVGVAIVGALAILGAVVGGLRATASAGLVCALLVIPVVVMLPLSGLVFIGSLKDLPTALATTGENAAALFGLRNGLDTAVLLLAAMGLGAGICGQPQVLEHFVAARSERAVRWSGLLAVAWLLLVLTIALALGWVARVDHGSIANPDEVMFEVPRRVMPPNFIALPIIAALALVICSVGNQLVVTCYGLLAVARGQAAPAVSLGRLRIVILLAGIAAASIAAVSGVGSSRGYLLAWLAVSAAVGPLILLACAGVRVRPGWAAGAARIAIALTLVLFLLRRERLIEIAMFLPFYAALLVALLGRKRELSGPTEPPV